MNKYQKYFLLVAGLALLVCAMRVFSMNASVWHKMRVTVLDWSAMTIVFALSLHWLKLPTAVELAPSTRANPHRSPQA